MKFIKELFSNPDGTGSTKRTAGWLLIFISILVGGVGLFITPISSAFDIIFISFLSSALSCFGLTSIDYRNFIKNK